MFWYYVVRAFWLMCALMVGRDIESSSYLLCCVCPFSLSYNRIHKTLVKVQDIFISHQSFNLSK